MRHSRDFAPMADVARDPRWGRCMESAGESPLLCAAMSAAAVRGFRGESIAEDECIACCVKHFAAYGLVQGGREYNPTDVSRTELFNSYFPPFQAALREGCDLLMPAFTPVDRLPAILNPWLLQTVLRKQWNFEGVVISDWGSAGELIAHGIARDLREAAEKAFRAGMDMDMMSFAYATSLADAVRKGTVSETALDQAVLRVLLLKNEMGLFERPYKNRSNAVQAQVCRDPAHLQCALEAALRSCVLLQNNGVLPLAQEAHIALTGDFAQEHGLLGFWSAGGRDDETPSLADVFGASALCAPEDADIIIFATGEPQAETGEAASKANLVLRTAQIEQLKRLHALEKPIVLVLFCGRPLILTDVLPLCDAVLCAWFPGSAGAEAVRRLLTGEANPSGHLAMTFPRSVGQIPIHHDMLTTGRPLGEQTQRFISRYLDERNEPLFPFGFGLSYTTFDVENASLSTKTVGADCTANVTCTVRNSGACDGETVVQLYVECKHGSYMHALRALKDFRRVALGAGESQTLLFPLTAEMLCDFDSDGLAVWNDRYAIYLGEDSLAPCVGEITFR